jgi:hypothetical protein
LLDQNRVKNVAKAGAGRWEAIVARELDHAIRRLFERADFHDGDAEVLEQGTYVQQPTLLGQGRRAQYVHRHMQI